MRLCPIPWASFGRPKVRHDLLKCLKRGALLKGGDVQASQRPHVLAVIDLRQRDTFDELARRARGVDKVDLVLSGVDRAQHGSHLGGKRSGMQLRDQRRRIGRIGRNMSTCKAQRVAQSDTW